jgi:ketosteroid isomerase-like protein
MSGSGQLHAPTPVTLRQVATSGRPRAEAPSETASENRSEETAAVATLHQLNADWIRSFLNCDAAWYSEHLGDDFICVLADGRRINKHDFLRRLWEQPRAETAGCDEVDVHLLDDAAVALVRGVIHVRGQQAQTVMRYTMVWEAKPERWQAVAAQFTPLGREQSPGKKRGWMIILHRAWRGS